MHIETLIKELMVYNKRAIAQAITLIENKRSNDQKLASQLLNALSFSNKKKQALRIGFTGVPGVGKSSLIEALGLFILSENKQARLGVLTIDPSSPLRGGSILGDKLRMQELAQHENVFIRSTPAGKHLGGVERHTHELIFLLESIGFDIIFIESTGVGQSEYALRNMVDVFLYVHMPATGDDVQAMKKGILELIDLVVVNKADDILKDEALLCCIELKKTLQSVGKNIDVLPASAREKTGIELIWNRLQKMKINSKERKNQLKNWFEIEVLATLKEYASQHIFPSYQYKEAEERILKDEIIPRDASQKILNYFLTHTKVDV